MGLLKVRKLSLLWFVVLFFFFNVDVFFVFVLGMEWMRS